MKLISYKQRNVSLIYLFLLLMLTVTGLFGCARTAGGIQVIPLNSTNVITLGPDDVVQIMRRAGFTDMQIWQYGTEVRNVLAQSGAVQIKVNRRVEAVFAVKDNSVYISTRLRGNFIYNIDKGWIGIGGG